MGVGTLLKGTTWPKTLPEEQLKLAANFSNPFTCFQHSSLSHSSKELFLSSPVLFWLLVNHSLTHKWRERKFLNTVALKRTEILGIICGCPDKLPKSALRFLSKFDGCKLQTDKAKETLTEWVSTGKYERLRHHKVLFPEVLDLLDDFPMLVGAKWIHSIDSTEIEIKGLRILIRDIVKMTEAMEVASIPSKDLSSFSTIVDIERHHDEILRLYLENIGVKTNMPLPDPPMAGTLNIIPITDSKLLFQEGNEQDNCVYSYLTEIQAGQYFVYQVKGQERATLGIRIGSDGAIELDQLFAVSNSQASKQTFEIVDCWLNSIGKESQLHLVEHKQKSIDDCMTAYMQYRTSQSSINAI
jgi:hypothetical protein